MFIGRADLHHVYGDEGGWFSQAIVREPGILSDSPQIRVFAVVIATTQISRPELGQSAAFFA